MASKTSKWRRTGAQVMIIAAVSLGATLVLNSLARRFTAAASLRDTIATGF